MAFLFLGLLYACTKQSPKQVTPDYSRSENFLARSKQCASVNFLEGVLENSNMQNLFGCVGWNKEFPALNRALMEVGKADWNRVMMPIDSEIASNPIIRTRMLTEIRRLFKNGSFDEIDRINKIIFSKNFIETYERILKFESKFQYEDFESILGLLNTNKYSRIWSMTYELFLPMYKNKERWKDELDFFTKIVALKEARVEIIDAFAKKLVDYKVDEVERVLIPAFMNTRDIQSGLPFIKSWLNSGSMNAEKFESLFMFSAIDYPQASMDFKLLYNYIQNPVTCGTNSKSLKTFGAKSEIKELSHILAGGSQLDFFEFLLSGKMKGMHMHLICREDVADFMGSVDRSIKNSSELMMDKAFFKFFQYAHQLPGNFNLDNHHDYFLGYLASDFFASINKMSKAVNEKQLNIYKLLYDVSKNYDPQVYNLISSNLHTAFSEQNKKGLIAIGKLWLDLTATEKDHLMKIVDEFWSKDNKGEEWLRGLLTIGYDLGDTLPGLYAKWGEQNTKSFYDSLMKVYSKLSDREVYLELQKFFSKDHILKIVEVMSLTGYDDESDFFNLPTYKAPFGMELKLLTKTDVKDDLEINKNCLLALSRELNGSEALYRYIMKFPQECKDIEFDSFGISFLQWLSILEYDFLEFDQRHDGPIVFGPKGFYSPATVDMLLDGVLIADEVYRKDGHEAGISQFVEDISGFFFQDKMYRAFLPLLDLVLLVNEKMENLDALIDYFVHFNEPNLRENVANASFLQAQMSSQKSTIRKYPEWDGCEKRLKSGLGVKPCQSVDEMMPILEKMLNISKRRFDGQQSLLEEIVEMIHPDGNYKIPFKSKKPPRSYQATLKDLTEFLYDLSDDRTRTTITFRDLDSTRKYSLNTIEQLEVVIRDISFANDFYGSFFKSDVARANKYQKKVKNMRALVGVMNVGRGLLRGLQWIPSKADKLRMRNVNQTYMSLSRLADPQPRSGRSYGDVVQSILVLVSKTSAIEYQKMMPFKKPDLNTPKFHNGIFLTEFVNLSGLRHAASWVRDRISNVDELVSDDDFLRTSQKLLMNVDKNLLKETLNYIADKDNGKWLLTQIQNFITDVESWSYQDIRLLENILADTLFISTFIGPDRELDINREFARNNFNFLVELTPQLLDLFDRLRITPEGRSKILTNLALMSRSLKNTLSYTDEFQIQCASRSLECKNRVAKATLEQRRIVYQILNQSFRKLKYIVNKFKDQYLASFINFAVGNSQQIEMILVDMLESYTDYYFKKLDKVGAEKFNRIMTAIMQHPKTTFEPLKDWVLRGLDETDEDGQPNPQFGSIIKILEYLTLPSDEQISHFEKGVNVMFGEYVKAQKDFLRTSVGNVEFAPNPPLVK